MRAIVLALALSIAAAAEEPRYIDLAGAATDEQFYPLKKIEQPSSICFAADRGTLFVIGDEGEAGEVGLDGKVIRHGKPYKEHTDIEGVTWWAAAKRLFIVIEGEDVIVELDPETFAPKARFPVGRAYAGPQREGVPKGDLIHDGGNGIEGITFVPDEASKEGGWFCAVNQDDPPLLLKIAAPIVSAKDGGEARIVEFWPGPIASLSEIQWDAERKHFYIESGWWNEWMILDDKMAVLARGPFPGAQTEGLTFDAEGHLWTAMDTGGIARYTLSRDVR